MSFLFRYEVFKVLYTSNSTGSHGFAVRSRAFALRSSLSDLNSVASVITYVMTADEGRDKLRKASGRSKYPSIRGFPNGATHMDRLHVSIHESIVYGR